jgi:thiamine pyrophosphokinase
MHSQPPATAGGFLLAIVFANGEFAPPADLTARIAHAELLIAADGGLRHMSALGLQPQVLIGDLDSVDARLRAEVEERGAKVLEYSPVKEQTDLELAFAYARYAGVTEILVLAGLGGRYDHSIANLLLPALPAFAELKITFLHSEQRLHVLRSETVLQAAVGERVSLIPIGGDAVGVGTHNLAYPLRSETLHLGSSRGVSNLVQAEGAKVSLQSGFLLCIISPPVD